MFSVNFLILIKVHVYHYIILNANTKFIKFSFITKIVDMNRFIMIE
jgi:hypothetical protein